MQRLCARLVLLVHGSVGWDSDDPTRSRLVFSFVSTLTVSRRDRRGSQVRPSQSVVFTLSEPTTWGEKETIVG